MISETMSIQNSDCRRITASRKMLSFSATRSSSCLSTS